MKPIESNKRSHSQIHIVVDFVVVLSFQFRLAFTCTFVFFSVVFHFSLLPPPSPLKQNEIQQQGTGEKWKKAEQKGNRLAERVYLLLIKAPKRIAESNTRAHTLKHIHTSHTGAL